ncbi:OmpA family protein [Tamlana sp. 2_MG-2023]|uniref:OmpA family protein n=1 Tax=unclassified Tamlana TaxID=2614803 RepID=UPI0026E42AFA|nr:MULTISPECIES: OmpA family protein [unclassified Tamlana]MDO6759846.1 OmpA family protein [Tamlana sp. 2_MG-2023]MDO6791469.1 OmpA family protein [Tamlana sp. 1_MG-2023]
MKKYIQKTSIVLLAVITLVSFVNCKSVENANNKQKGAAIGVAGGALLGAIIGNNVGSGNSELGAAIGAAIGGGAGVVIGNKMDKQAQEIEEEVPGAQVERVDQGIVVTFEDGSGVYFATNKYNINSESQETLTKLVGIFQDNPDTNLMVVGHTDSQGDANYNMTLSKNRANAVTGFLKQKGVSSSRLETHWFGEEQPVADNNTAEGRAKNRRVNIVIVPNDDMINDAKQEAGN